MPTVVRFQRDDHLETRTVINNVEHLPLLEMTQTRDLELIHTKAFVENGHLGWTGWTSTCRSGVFATHVTRELTCQSDGCLSGTTVLEDPYQFFCTAVTQVHM